MYKLYKVAVAYEYVVAINEEDDVHIKIKETYGDALENEVFDFNDMVKNVEEITRKNQLPKGWDDYCIPYGDDIREAPISAYNLKQE
jgi:hypothetical protein